MNLVSICINDCLNFGHRNFSLHFALLQQCLLVPSFTSKLFSQQPNHSLSDTTFLISQKLLSLFCRQRIKATESKYKTIGSAPGTDTISWYHPSIFFNSFGVLIYIYLDENPFQSTYSHQPCRHTL